MSYHLLCHVSTRVWPFCPMQWVSPSFRIGSCFAVHRWLAGVLQWHAVWDNFGLLSIGTLAGCGYHSRLAAFWLGGWTSVFCLWFRGFQGVFGVIVLLYLFFRQWDGPWIILILISSKQHDPKHL